MQFSEKCIDDAQQKFKETMGAQYTREQTSEALRNLCGFFEVLMDWDREQRLKAEEEVNVLAAIPSPEVAEVPEATCKLLTEKETAQYLNISTSWLRHARTIGGNDVPPFIKIGRSIRYRLQDLDAWLETRVRTNTLQA